MRTKRAALEQALAGHVRDHHRFLLAQHLIHLDFLDEQVDTFTHQISVMSQADEPPNEQELPVPHANAGSCSVEPQAHAADQSIPPLEWEAAVQLLDTIPGVGRETDEVIIAED